MRRCTQAIEHTHLHKGAPSVVLIKSPEFREQILWSDVREELVLVADGRDFFPRAGVKRTNWAANQSALKVSPVGYTSTRSSRSGKLFCHWRDRPRFISDPRSPGSCPTAQRRGLFCPCCSPPFQLLGPEDHTLHRLLEVPLGWVLLAADVVHQSVPHAVLAVEEGLPFDQLAEAALGIHRAPEAALPLHILVQELRALCHIPLPSSQGARAVALSTAPGGKRVRISLTWASSLTAPHCCCCCC